MLLLDYWISLTTCHRSESGLRSCLSPAELINPCIKPQGEGGGQGRRHWEYWQVTEEAHKVIFARNHYINLKLPNCFPFLMWELFMFMEEI